MIAGSKTTNAMFLLLGPLEIAQTVSVLILILLSVYITAGLGSSIQQRKLKELNAKLQAAERRAQQAERTAQLAESDAHHKDIKLCETLNRIRLYESVSESIKC